MDYAIVDGVIGDLIASVIAGAFIGVAVGMRPMNKRAARMTVRNKAN